MDTGSPAPIPSDSQSPPDADAFAHRMHTAEAEVLRLRQHARDLLARQQRRIGDLVHRHERERMALTATVLAASQALDHMAASRQDVVRAYVTSTSWRMTRPIRVANRLMRRQGLHAPALALPPPPVLEAVPGPAPLDVAGLAKTAMRELLRIRLEAFLASSAVLRLPRADQPAVSILLVLYNQAELTLACLSAIVETLNAADAPGIEVVIVDNASSDATHELLDRVQNATVIRNRTNLHFLHGVNAGARAVRGTSILLLNNDALLLPGALASALRTLDSAPDIGAVGGRVILPDARLQEAGSIVWSSGACLGYGRGENPADPRFAFQRDVDFCSGAFLLVPTRLWTVLGGFDERFAPAYYEEVDFCVRLRRSGFRVVFDPDATIVHYEFGSAAASREALALQATNHAVFQARHADWLGSRLADLPANRLAASDTGPGWRLLLLLRPGEDPPRALQNAIDAGVRVTLLATGERGGAGLDRRVETAHAAGPAEVAAFIAGRAGLYRLAVCGPHPELRALLAEAGLALLDLGDEAGLRAALVPPVRIGDLGVELPTSRPAESDVALAVPFRFAPLAEPRPGVGVFCHLFHPEMAAVLRPYLENIGAIGLHVSTDTQAKADTIRAAFADMAGPPPDIRVVPNRGRDVAAKLLGFPGVQARYDVVLHVHGKRSDHTDFLAPWGRFLLENLAGSPSVVSSVLDAFARLPGLGMIAAQHFEPIRRWIGWHGNFVTALGLADRMGLPLHAGRALDFPSGSMFWARPAALQPLLDLGLTWEDFPDERGQQDHTLAHAIERLFFFSCERSGLSWLKVADPALFHDPAPIIDIPDARALLDFAATRIVRLGGEESVPVRPEPAPMLTTVSPGLARRIAARVPEMER